MSVRLPSGILAQFETNLALVTNASSTGGTLTPSGYRWTLDKEPDSAMDGRYFLSFESITPRYRYWGTGENISGGVVTVQLSYYRGGGDAGGGDRQSVMRDAADDMQIVADVCENPENYNSGTTGLRDIEFQGATKVHDLKHAEVWEARFLVQWRSDLATTPVSADSGDSVSLMHLTGEYVSADLAAGEEVVDDPMYVNFDDFSFSTIKVRLTAAARVTAGTGTFRVRLGGTLGGTDGTVVAYFTSTSTTYTAANGLGDAFNTPAGEYMIQVTMQNSAVGAACGIKGIGLAISDGAA